MTKMDVLDQLMDVRAMLQFMSMTSMGMLDEKGEPPSEMITVGGRILFDSIDEKLKILYSSIEAQDLADGL